MEFVQFVCPGPPPEPLLALLVNVIFSTFFPKQYIGFSDFFFFFKDTHVFLLCLYFNIHCFFFPALGLFLMYFNNQSTQRTNKTEKRRRFYSLYFNYVCLNIFWPPVIDFQHDNVIGIKNSVITQVLQNKTSFI
jgi:hypothetical protein